MPWASTLDLLLGDRSKEYTVSRDTAVDNKLPNLEVVRTGTGNRGSGLPVQTVRGL
jgi:hypothetical protein